MQFPATFTANADDETTTVRFPDIPEAITFVADGDDIAAAAVDCLQEALAARIADREDIPEPASATKGLRLVPLPTLIAAKVLLWRELRRRSLRKADLARLLNIDPRQVDRLFDFRHASRPDQIDAAFLALGRRLDVVLLDAAE